jgi:two-component system sensor histidine kinase KdpD
MSVFKQYPATKRIVHVIAFSAAVLVVTRLALQFGKVANTGTVGFSFLILVTLSAFFADMTVAVITSVIAGLCFNYFFLPPIGTWTIAAVDDWIALAALLLTAIAISRLTSSARAHWDRAKMLDDALMKLKEFGVWLLSVPHDRLTLSGTASEVVKRFAAEYCSIHVFVEGKWHHFSGVAQSELSEKIESRLRSMPDHPTDALEIAEEHAPGMRYAQINQGDTPLALLAIKSGSLPSSAINVLAYMIGLRLADILQNRQPLP